VPAGYPDAHEIAKRAKVQFDSHLSSDRYQVVVSLFDQMVTFRLKDLQAATKAIHEAERKLKAKPNAQAADLLKQARSYAYSPLVSDSMIKDERSWSCSARTRRTWPWPSSSPAWKTCGTPRPSPTTTRRASWPSRRRR
jgi:phosphoglycerate transport regulatory protein PgtC